MKVKIKKLLFDAILPEYKTSGSAGADVFSAENTIIKQGEIKAISTGISVSIPEGYHISIRPRSGLALKQGITVANAPGTIDSDYRGEIKIILINHSSEDFEIKKGMRIAQMLLEENIKIEWEETSQLDDTDRGSGGFGHTGL